MTPQEIDALGPEFVSLLLLPDDAARVRVLAELVREAAEGEDN